MTSEPNLLPCTKCGRRYRLPPGRQVAADSFVCPSCARSTAAGGTGEELLAACPVCGNGRVARASADRSAHEFICNRCASVIEETIFGFQYKTIDSRAPAVLEQVKGKTFTLAELKDLAKAKADETQPPPKPTPPPEAATPETDTAPVARPAGAKAGELYWMVDHEAMARREREKQQAKKKGVTVDDLLKEIGREGGPAPK